MRATIAFAVVAVVLALFGFAFLGVARLEGHMADARTATLDAAVRSGTGEPDRRRTVREPLAVRAISRHAMRVRKFAPARPPFRYLAASI